MYNKEIITHIKGLLKQDAAPTPEQKQALQEICNRLEKPALSKEDIAFIAKTILEILSVAVPLLHH